MMKKFLTLLCFLPIAADAQQNKFEYEFDHEKPWIELQTQLPSYPQPENMLQFDAGPASNNLHYVDASSIAVGEDSVVRYSLVVKSPSGAMNVSYEGIRCQTAEKRTYAYGRSDNTWSRARLSKWADLENIAQNYAQRALYRYYFCPLGIHMVKDAEEAISALKAGIHPRAVRY
ncbi:CNP1-like family protein [Nitrosospira sp. Nsp5]|uniref:CNP1-like family protein n=1 Tax=Nitrosospira multiformis TaxID=1231 RepID=A0ABY0TC77_9PROT|nr:MULTISPECIES: CNP1-like family protein [Nitrosospira]PTR05842.1 CNP1-like family protein [Nitrosospira sp. Nsp5]SDQ60937.1 CNP1-like family protein [Nitrosospira multiformis]